jgi:hypothetical protein
MERSAAAHKKQLLPRRETRQELSARKIALKFLSATFRSKLIILKKFLGQNGSTNALFQQEKLYIIVKNKAFRLR